MESFVLQSEVRLRSIRADSEATVKLFKVIDTDFINESDFSSLLFLLY